MALNFISPSNRCCAPRRNLDTPDALHRSRDYTEALVEVGTLGELWDEFGIVGDLIVSILSLRSELLG